MFGSEKYQAIYDRIKYLISLKSGITYIVSHYLQKAKLSFTILYLQKKDSNVIIYIKSVLKKGKNHYYYKTFLETSSIISKIITTLVRSIIMVRFREKEIAKEKCYGTKKHKNKL